MQTFYISIVAIRFRWIWVEKVFCDGIRWLYNHVAIRFRWIWVEKEEGGYKVGDDISRNPLSLDMG